MYQFTILGHLVTETSISNSNNFAICRFHTVGTSPVTRAQAGPKDLEVVIRPAIQKSASVDSAFHNEAPASEVWVDKQIHAPLAKQESLNETMLVSLLNFPGCLVKLLV